MESILHLRYLYRAEKSKNMKKDYMKLQAKNVNIFHYLKCVFLL